jgi:hypothetical protein
MVSMKNLSRTLGIIAMLAVIGLVVVGCGEDPADSLFVPSTNSDTANDVNTLGLVGTAVTSSAKTVADAAIASGKIAITSVAKGTATITVSDAADRKATISVTVSETGAITIGTIVKYTPQNGDPGSDPFNGTWMDTNQAIKIIAANGTFNQYVPDSSSTWTEVIKGTYSSNANGSVEIVIIEINPVMFGSNDEWFTWDFFAEMAPPELVTAVGGQRQTFIISNNQFTANQVTFTKDTSAAPPPDPLSITISGITGKDGKIAMIALFESSEAMLVEGFVASGGYQVVNGSVTINLADNNGESFTDSDEYYIGLQFNDGTFYSYTGDAAYFSDVTDAPSALAKIAALPKYLVSANTPIAFNQFADATQVYGLFNPPDPLQGTWVGTQSVTNGSGGTTDRELEIIAADGSWEQTMTNDGDPPLVFEIVRGTYSTSGNNVTFTIAEINVGTFSDGIDAWVDFVDADAGFKEVMGLDSDVIPVTIEDNQFTANEVIFTKTTE